MNNNESELHRRNLGPGVWIEGLEIVFNPNIAVPEGIRRASYFITESIKNRESVRINEEFVRNVHKQSMYFLDKAAGAYRISEGKIVSIEYIDGERKENKIFLTEPGSNLEHRMYLYSRWLEEQTQSLKEYPEDILRALLLASEAHYGLISPQLHPFNDGNGRVARLLANAILMLNAHETMYYGMPVLPIPIMRQTGKDRKQPDGSPKQDPYTRILNQVHNTGDLAPFDVFLADKWVENLQEILKNIYRKVTKHRTGVEPVGDRHLREKYMNRVSVLNQFIIDQQNPKSIPSIHLIPDYFELKRIRKGI